MSIETAKAISNLVPDCRLVAIRELLAEHDEDQRVIAVWRGRTERAEDERDALKAEIDRLREWQRQMVEKAASGGRLDGYRELAGKLAAKDAENDRLRAALVAAMAIVQQDRTDMYIGSVHARTGELAPEDAEAIARLDAIIAQADAAMGREG